MTQQQQETILTKVKKLLALAENNTSADESQNSFLKAQMLLLKHGLTMNDVAESDISNTKNVLNTSIDESSRMAWWKKSLANIISNNFRCKSFTSFRTTNTRICIIGLEEDVNIATEIYNCAVRTIEHQSKMYVKLNKKNGKSAGLKNDFIIGWLKGLEDKFKKQVESVKEYGLILVKDALVVAEVEKMKLRTGQRSKITANRDENARSAGYRQGNSFNGNSKMIGCNC